MKPAHRQCGYVWRLAGEQSYDPTWYIYGHFSRDEALDLILIEGDHDFSKADLAAAVVKTGHHRLVKAGADECCGDCTGYHYVQSKPGKGASPYTLVELP